MISTNVMNGKINQMKQILLLHINVEYFLDNQCWFHRVTTKQLGI